jgi:hypothetical protein
MKGKLLLTAALAAGLAGTALAAPVPKVIKWTGTLAPDGSVYTGKLSSGSCIVMDEGLLSGSSDVVAAIGPCNDPGPVDFEFTVLGIPTPFSVTGSFIDIEPYCGGGTFQLLENPAGAAYLSMTGLYFDALPGCP